MLSNEEAQHYLFEIRHEAELVDYLYRRFQHAAEAWLAARHIEERDGLVAWSSIESEREMQVALEGILSGYARVSLFVFPERNAGKRAATRSERLRQLLEVKEDHPIWDRSLRNHWMHLDERLDAALEESGVVPVGYHLALSHHLSEQEKLGTFRLIDPGEERVYIFGTAYPLRALADAVAHVKQQAVLALLRLTEANHQLSNDKQP